MIRCRCGSAQKKFCAVYYEYPCREKRTEIWVIFLESFPDSNWTRKRKCDIMNANFDSQTPKVRFFVSRRKMQPISAAEYRWESIYDL